MNQVIVGLIAGVALAGVAPAAAYAADASDPTEPHRWHMPRRGARKLAQEAVGPVHAEWNLFGQLVNDGKAKLGDWGIRFDVDLNFFDQHASRVIAGRKNFGSFSWRVMGDWQLFDLGSSEHLSAIGKGYLGWNAFGTEGLGYDPVEESLTANVGAVNTLNATVFSQGAVLDELFWKQVALGGKLLVLAGKIDQLYHFDTNRVANDGYSQFFSYSLQNNPSIPGPLYGGFGGIVRFNPSKQAYGMFGVGDSSMDKDLPPWETLDNDSWYQLLELGLCPEIPVLGKGNYRLTPWHNHLFGADGFGVALNVDQELGRKDVVAFFRFGYGDDDVTPVKIFVSGGVAFEAPFGREGDLVAIGVAWSDPSPDVGFRSETLLELFYRVELAKAISITPDLQLVFNPANNLEDELVVVPGIRLHLKF
jgi:carbohydrate-selective porin OprB